ncbi:type II secretion system F family protein [Weissella paramesenteroides]|uniref:type II secretion system F family protein n=1 Tax=Weissella paramesenteroides TaxID=1249 RepID=UPI002E7B4492|nr:type II secretion system F family protein [Weissella paramesenteroides]WPQ67434.1 type II secretion system F family protein [Weissella paramesenteroides]
MQKQTQWSRKLQVEFFENLCHLSKVGFDLESSLMTLQILLKLPIKDVENIIIGLTAGLTLAEVMSPFIRTEIVQQLDFAIIHGQLTPLLQELGARERGKLVQFRKLRQILLYPLILMILLVVLIIGYLTILLPELGQSGADLAILKINLKPSWLIIGIIVPMLGLSLSIWWFAKLCWETRIKIIMKCPIIGTLLTLSVEYYICLQLGLLLSSGVELATIVAKARKKTTNGLISYVGDKAWHALSNGENIRDCILSVAFLPKECALLFNLGHTQQQIGENFQILANRKFELLDERIKKYLTLIQPICFAIIGVVVIGLYYLTLVPMYKNMGGIVQ